MKAVTETRPVFPGDSRSLDYYEKFHQDNGCEVSTSCLACPLPACKHDNPLFYQRWRRQVRDRHIVRQMKQRGLSVSRAALVFQVTERTIFRIIARVRKEAQVQHLATGGQER